MGKAEYSDLQHFGMNTVMTHRAFGVRAAEALQAVKHEAERLESLLSRFLPESDVSRVNRFAGMKAEPVSAETYEVLARAEEFSRTSPGLFDVTVGPLVNLWSGSRESCEPPGAVSISQVLPLVNYKDLSLDSRRKTAMLQLPGQSIDLGGIGKGYAGDKFLEVFREYGVTSAFTNLGGNVVALGTKPDGSPWRVGIRHPRAEGSLLGLVTVKDKAVVTSGDYQRFYTGRDGRRYHHILDPRTGYPADSGLVSVTVVTGNSMDADALSTMVFVGGKDNGLSILGQFPGAEAVLVDTEMKVTLTAGLRDSFQAADNIEFEVLK